MPNNKFIFGLITLAVVVAGICKLDFGQQTKENWWGGIGRTWKTMPVVRQPGSQMSTAAGGNFIGVLGDDQFIKRPQFQGLLSPRFGNVDMGANIRYNPADYANTGIPCKPLAFGDMAEENYRAPSHVKENYPGSACGRGQCGSGCGPSCGKGGMPVSYQGGSDPTPSGYAAGNFNKVMDQVYDQSSYPEATDALPVGTMTSIDAEGNVTEPVVYQRFMFANQKSRLRALGDKIRGDLPIVPNEVGWFSVYPNVNLDLEQGAMNVLGGVTNDTNRSLAQLINQTSGDTAIGGVNLANVNMTPQYSTSYSAGLRDVNVSGYP